MAVVMPNTATQYWANALTFNRGGPDDVNTVGVFYGADPNTVPAVEDYTTTRLVQPPDPLAEGDLIDILSRVGAREDADVHLAAGDYQVWLLVVTDDEDIMFKQDTVTIL